MGATLSDQVETARARAELARLKVETAHDQTRLRLLKRLQDRANMKYDAVDATQDTKRRRPARETKGEDSILNKRERQKGVATGRNLQRNSASFRALMTQLSVCVVGKGPKLQLITKDSTFGASASSWFNSDYAKYCDGVDDTPLPELVANAVCAASREGDQLWVFDDFDRDDGSIRIFESDQLVTIEEGDWKRRALSLGWAESVPGKRNRQAFTQENGIIRDRRGRVQAYAVCLEHGRASAPIDEVTIIPRWHMRDNPTGSAKLFKRPWRPNQYRGVGDALTIANQQQDIYEMVAAELQSAKKAAQTAGWVTPGVDSESGVIRAMQAAGLDADEIEKALYGNGENPGSLGAQYEKLEGLTGGKMEYLQPGDEFTINDHEKPASSVREFGDWVQTSSGAALGIARSRSTLKAETSYTAFRGEELMTWETIYVMQKAVERRLMDWVAFKAIGWGLRKGLFTESAPDGWHQAMRWTWPTMPEVDIGRAAEGERVKLKNGTTNYEKILGPDWRDHFDSLADALDYAKERGLPLSLFETVSGGAAVEPEDETNGDDTDEE